MKIGPHLILGFEGTWPSDDFLRLLKEEEIGGVILFARNLESLEQIEKMIRCLQEAREGPLLVSVDHEGGRVFRMPEPFTPLPPARVFGQYYDRSGDISEIEAIAELIGHELRSVGFNLNFAPVLDVDSRPDNPIIGDRAFHSDPTVVASIGTAFIRGFAKAGLISCGKHFPGHGDTADDSHKTLPSVVKSSEELKSCEVIPFWGAIEAHVPSLMTAHVLYPALDPDHCATLSPMINRTLLREGLGFRGVLFSDDLLMEGVCQDRPVPEAAEAALMAGCDALLLCKDFELQRETLAYLGERLTADEELPIRLTQSLERLLLLQQGLEKKVSAPADVAQQLQHKLTIIQA